MIRNVYDWFTLFAIALIVMLRMLLWICLSPFVYYAIFPLVFLVFILYNIKHNHLHFRIFCNRKLNLLLENILNIFTGTTFSSMKIIHLINHHAVENKAGDWGYTKPFERERSIKSLSTYIMATLISFAKNKRNWLRTKGGVVLKRYANIEASILFSMYAVMLFVNPWNTVLYILVPNVICQIVLLAFNYLQHGACDADSPYNHSRNFTGKMLNSFVFNAGFHTAHHLKPTLHWSEYPTFHASIEDRIDPDLNVDNLLKFLIKHAIRPN